MKPQRRTMLDPAVADLLAGMEQRQSEAQLPRRQRDKKRREREKMARRNRVMVDLPPALEAAVSALAEAHGVSVSGLITLAVWRFLADDPDIRPYKRPSISPRYEYKIVLPENPHDHS